MTFGEYITTSSVIFALSAGRQSSTAAEIFSNSKAP